MKNIIAALPLVIGFALLFTLLGYYLAGMNRRTVVTVTTVDRWFERPAERDTVRGRRVQPTAAHINRADSTIADAVNGDSLAQLAETLAEPFEVEYVDSVSVKDSLGGFSGRFVQRLLVDPLEKIITRTKQWQDLKLSTVNTATTEQPTWWQVVFEYPLLFLFTAITFYVLGAR